MGDLVIPPGVNEEEYRKKVRDGYRKEHEKSLIDTLGEMPQSTLSGKVCKACRTLEYFTEEEAEAFTDCLLSGVISLDGLSLALLRHGYSVSEKTLRRHKRNCLGNTYESD